MGDVLFRFFLSIGVGLGLIVGQADPVIGAKVLRQDRADAGLGTMLVAEVQVDEAFSPGSRELVESGSSVALKVVARLAAKDGGSWETAAIRTLAWDPRSRRFKVGFVGEGREVPFADFEAAMTLASRFHGLALCPAARLASGGRVTIEAHVGLIDASGAWHDAPVLWNYVRPGWSSAFGSPTEVPF
jgi:hypothetical protein